VAPAWSVNLVLLENFGYGWRRLWKQPGLTFVALLSMALGTSANSALFSPRAPRIPFVSGATGRILSPAEAADPAYWARQIREALVAG
jgi:hypothetical protein